MAQMAGLHYTTVNEGIRARLARLKTLQDAGRLRPAIKAIDAALTGRRDPDGSLHLDPRAYFRSAIHGIDVGA